GGQDRVVSFWAMAKDEKLPLFAGNWDRFSCMALAPDGKTLATGGWDGQIHLRETATGKELRQWGQHQGNIVSLAFAPDGKTLASTDWGEAVHLWDVATLKELPSPRPLKDGAFQGIAFSSCGRTLAVASGREVHFWDCAAEKFVGKISIPSSGE